MELWIFCSRLGVVVEERSRWVCRVRGEWVERGLIEQWDSGGRAAGEAKLEGG